MAVREGKRNPTDFVLWRRSPPDQQRLMEWSSPWGTGAPGWHLECSTMSMKYLGERFDVHTGGIDHLTVHHTNEVAQSECALGVHPWVQFLDGVMQAPGRPEEDPTGGFKHGGWVAGHFDDFLGRVMVEQMSRPFDLLLGRKTYEIFAAHWPYGKNKEDPIAAGINNAKKYVASRTLTTPHWSNSELIKGDVAKRLGT